MSASLIQSLGSSTPSLQEEMARRFTANLAQNPEARAAFEKATGGNTPASSPAALRALENEQMAAARRANQLAAGREAVAAKKMEQEAFGPRPSGLMQSQVTELPGGGKAVYDREGRLVGTNIPVSTGMPAADRADFNRGEGLTSERSALRPAMEDAVRKAMEARVAAQSQAEAAPLSPQSRTFTEALTEVNIPNFAGTRPLAPSATPIPTTAAAAEVPVEPARPQLGPMPTSLAGTGFAEQLAQFYAPPPPPAESDPFASRTTPGLENVLRKLLPITVGRSGQGEALAGQVLPRSEGKLASAFRLLTEWPGVSDADVAELANAFPDMDWTTKGLTAAEASRKFQRQLNELARSGRITAASDREVTSRVGPYSVQQEQFDYRLQTPEERVRAAFAR